MNLHYHCVTIRGWAMIPDTSGREGRIKDLALQSAREAVKAHPEISDWSGWAIDVCDHTGRSVQIYPMTGLLEHLGEPLKVGRG